MIIAVFVCNYLNVNTLKLQQISLITKSIDIYNSSNSRYFTFFLFLLFIKCIVNFRRDSAMNLEQSQSSFYEVVDKFACNICNVRYKIYRSLHLLFALPVILLQSKVYLGITEIPIHFRAIEMITVLFKDDP